MAELKYTFTLDVSQAITNAQNLVLIFRKIQESLTSIGTREAQKAVEAIDKFVLSFEKLKPTEFEKIRPAIEGVVRELSKLEDVRLTDIRTFVENLKTSLAEVPNISQNLVASLDTVSARLGELAVRSGSARMVMASLNYVIRDLPWGFIGVANNVDMLAQGFIELSRQTGSVGAALRALGSALVGPTGITFLVSAAVSALTFYTLRHRKSVEETVLSYEQLIEKIREFRREIEEKPISLSKIKSEWEKLNEEVDRQIAKVIKRITEIRQQISQPSLTGVLGQPIADIQALNKELEKLEARLSELTQIKAVGPFPELINQINSIIDATKRFSPEQAQKFIETLRKQFGSLRIEVLEVTLDWLNEEQKKLDIGSEKFQKNAHAIRVIQEAIKALDESLKKMTKLEDVFKIERDRFELFEKLFKVGAISADEFIAKIEAIINRLEELKKKTKDEKLGLEIQLKIEEAKKLIEEARIQPIKDAIDEIKNKISALKVDFKLKLIDETTYAQSLESQRETLLKILDENAEILTDDLKRQINDILLSIEQVLDVELFQQKLKEFENRLQTIQIRFKLGDITWGEAKEKILTLKDEFLKFTKENYDNLTDELKLQTLKFRDDLEKALQVDLELEKRLETLGRRVNILTLLLSVEVDKSAREKAIEELRNLRNILDEELRGLSDSTGEAVSEQMEKILRLMKTIDGAIEGIERKTETATTKFARTIARPFETATDRMIDYWIIKWVGGLEQARSDWERFLMILEAEFMQMIARLAVFSIFKGLASIVTGGAFQTGFEQGIKEFFGLRVQDINVPTISGINIVVPQETRVYDEILNRLRTLDSKILVQVNNQIHQQVETDWVRVNTGIAVSQYRKHSKRI